MKCPYHDELAEDVKEIRKAVDRLEISLAGTNGAIGMVPRLNGCEKWQVDHSESMAAWERFRTTGEKVLVGVAIAAVISVGGAVLSIYKAVQ